jgi:hypothetical protein
MTSPGSHRIRAARLFASAVAIAVAGLIAPPACAQKDSGPQRPRLLLVFAPNENDKSLVDQYQRLQNDTGEVNAEDVDVLYVIGDRPVKLPPPDARTETAENMRKHYHVDATGFRVVLVGDDGWEKRRWTEPTDPHEILRRASDMPKPKSALDSQK